MILFYDDWKKYPNAVLQLNTKNDSFLHVARLLKHMGIKNHAFMLSLLNPKLLDVDPWSDNLTNEEISMISEECFLNPWYFLREVFRIPSIGGNLLPLIANRANISYFWLFFNHVTTYLIQPRQTGKSLSYETKNAYLSGLKVRKFNISILVKDDKLRAGVSRKIVDKLEEGFPWYLKMISNRDVKNSERITVKAFENVIDLYVGQKDPKTADNIGRGMSTPVVDIDEFAYVYNIEKILPVIFAATTAVREIAEEKGLPYGNTLLTTPGKLKTKEGQFAYEIYKEAFRWTEKLFDVKDRKELNEVMIKNSKYKAHVICLLEYNHRQLGFTDDWLLERMEVARAEGEDAEADFLMKWGSGSLNHPLTKKQLEIIENSKMQPLDTEIFNGYVLRLYDKFKDTVRDNRYTPYVISIDPSEGIGRDDIALVIMNVYTGEVVGAGNYNEASIPSFSKFVYDLLSTYPNSVLIVERKSTGVAVLDGVVELMVKNGVNPFRRIFNWVIDDLDLYVDRYSEILEDKMYSNYLYLKFKSKFGFVTSGGGVTARSNLYGPVLKSAASYIGDVVRDEVLVEQILSLSVVNGRVDHKKDGHDDMVIAWLLAYWFLNNAKNKEVYGIDGSKVLARAVNLELLEDATEEEREYIMFQEELKEKIEELLESLENVASEIEAYRIIGKIRILKEKLDPKYTKTFNLDTILKEMKFYKRLKKLGVLKDF